MGMPFHPFWLIILTVLGGGAAIVVVAVAVLVRAVVGSPARPAYGLRSPDGRFWWDGRQWQPLPPPHSDA